MADTGRLDELKRKFDENPRRYFAPLANEYRKAGEPERAIELCRTYLPQQPNHMSGYIVYGQALADAGRSDEAAAVFNQALTLDPENIIALRYLGDIARDSGDSAAAMRWYGKVLELDPRNEEVASYITALAAPGATTGRTEPTRAAFRPPPPIRPEPEFDPAAVALEDLVSEPDIRQPEPSEPTSGAAPQPNAESFAPPAPESADDFAGAAQFTVIEESFDMLIWPESRGATELSGASEVPPAVTESTPPESTAREEPEQVQAAPAPTPFEEVALAENWTAPQDRPSVVEPDPAESDEAESQPARAEPAAGTGEPIFVTETIAQLYMQQGLREEALAVYRQLAITRNEPHIQERLKELEGKRPPANEAAPSMQPAQETVREFFARIGLAHAHARPHIAADHTAGLEGIFGNATLDPDDVTAAQTLAGAFAGPEKGNEPGT